MSTGNRFATRLTVTATAVKLVAFRLSDTDAVTVRRCHCECKIHCLKVVVSKKQNERSVYFSTSQDKSTDRRFGFFVQFVVREC